MGICVLEMCLVAVRNGVNARLVWASHRCWRYGGIHRARSRRWQGPIRRTGNNLPTTKAEAHEGWWVEGDMKVAVQDAFIPMYRHFLCPLLLSILMVLSVAGAVVEEWMVSL